MALTFDLVPLRRQQRDPEVSSLAMKLADNALNTNR